MEGKVHWLKCPGNIPAGFRHTCVVFTAASTAMAFWLFHHGMHLPVKNNE